MPHLVLEEGEELAGEVSDDDVVHEQVAYRSRTRGGLRRNVPHELLDLGIEDVQRGDVDSPPRATAAIS